MNIIIINNNFLKLNLSLIMNLSLAGKNLQSIYDDEELKNPQKIIHLDLSCNILEKGSEFNVFVNLKTLIIDQNNFSSLDNFPKLWSVNTFSANKNNFSNLSSFVDTFSIKFPNCFHLSVIKNPFNPFFDSEIEYNKFRYKVLKKLNYLKNLDGLPAKYDFLNAVQEKSNVKVSKNLKFDDRQEEEKTTEIQNSEKKGTIEYHEKYIYRNPSKNIGNKSVGNRFIKNNQL